MSMTKRASGVYQFQFHDRAGNRKSRSLGKIPKTMAREPEGRLRSLVTGCNRGVAPDRATAAWLEDLDVKFVSKLQAPGLVEPPANEAGGAPTVLQFIDDYVARRTDVKPGTLLTFRNVRNNVEEFFKSNPPITAVNKGLAGDMYRCL